MEDVRLRHTLILMEIFSSFSPEGENQKNALKSDPA
jgi:hypothetical protein